MIDIRQVRDEPDAVRKALARRGVDPAEVDKLLDADARARRAVGLRDELRATVRELSRRVGEARKAGDDTTASTLTEESRRAAEDEKRVAAEADVAQSEVRHGLLWLPNLPSEDAPDGAGPEDNPVVR
ncbi:MAG TPA: serine--tRNA ligase, partial [Acidimicrobiales bacterium]|nr:serine--tRNA ligase [Acidimicrobiales bacterium]